MSHPFLTERLADLTRAASFLQAGELVAIPTETVYGLAANALDDQAVEKIFTAKGRPHADPLIVHVSDLGQATQLAELSPQAEALAAAFWPGALTLVLTKKPLVSDRITAGLPSVALRSPAHPVTRRLLEIAKLPLAAPSANPFGYISPTKPEHVRDSLGERCPHIIDGGACTIGLESTILSLVDPEKPTLLRPGPITAEELESALSQKVHRPQQPASDDQAQAAPGMMSRHYSPHTALALLAPDQPPPPPVVQGKRAWVLLQRPVGYISTAGCDLYWLSEQGDLKEASRNAFDVLRQLDRKGYAQLFIETPKAEGIGLALCDRLQRAAAKRA